MPTIWIVGTSVSIEEGGYTTWLRAMLDRCAVRIMNLSVGDQTSIMGYMRVMAHRNEIRSGDLVVWEYSLLDTLLTAPIDDIFSVTDVHSARRLAWHLILQSGAGLMVLLTPPRQLFSLPSECESTILVDAKELDLPWLDLRDVVREIGLVDPETQYRDDRHPRIDSPLIEIMAKCIVTQFANVGGVPSSRLAAWSDRVCLPIWHWRSGSDLARGKSGLLKVYENSQMNVRAVLLAPGEWHYYPTTLLQRLRFFIRRHIDKAACSGWRTVALGVVSTHGSGCLDCAHFDCVATSATLPGDLSYAFLLRATRLSCRHELGRLCATSDLERARKCWSDYGQARPSNIGPVAVFGVIFTASAATFLKPRAV